MQYIGTWYAVPMNTQLGFPSEVPVPSRARSGI